MPTLTWEQKINVAGMTRLAATVLPIMAAALDKEAEAVMADSKENYVPVDTGRLRASGFVERPQIAVTGVTVRLGYGTDYAVYVHERLNVHHPVGQAKYLERPLLEAMPGIEARLAAAFPRGTGATR